MKGWGFSSFAALCAGFAMAAENPPPLPPERPAIVPAGKDTPPLPPPRPSGLEPAPQASQDEPAQAAPATPAAHGADPGCRARLAEKGVVVDGKRAIPAPPSEACAIEEPVFLVGARRGAGADITFPERPLLSCAMAETLAAFAVEALDPLARERVSSAVKSVGTGPGYECRPRNRQPGAKLSAHARGLAVDIMRVEFEKGPPLWVEKRDGPGHAQFVDGLLEKACVAFNTVLGPKSDSLHANNIHLDLEPRGRDGRTKYCR